LFNFDGCAPDSIKNWVGTTENVGGTKKIITTTTVPLHF